MKFSFIIPIYNRPDEIDELLESLSKQEGTRDFEIVIVEDGSSIPCKHIVEKYQDKLEISYYTKSNSGPGKSRNYGLGVAKGDYFIFLDSDTIAPPTYFNEVKKELAEQFVDAFGGPDAADAHFSPLQKAITFSMTSLLTTGGIRGKKKSVGKFQPRSFNMGISRKVYETIGGFSNLRIGEDPDLSMTIWEKGMETRLFPAAKVYHKRRSTLKSFAKQVFQFGAARPILNQRHPQFTKLTFWFPSVFLLGIIAAVLMASISCFLPSSFFRLLLQLPIILVGFYYLLVFVFSSITYKSLKVGFLSIITTSIQFFSYGYGFLLSQWRLNVMKQKPEQAFPSHFHQS